MLVLEVGESARRYSSLTLRALFLAISSLAE